MKTQDIRALCLARMKALGLSARALAIRADIPERTLQQFASGHTQALTTRNLERLFAALEIKLV